MADAFKQTISEGYEFPGEHFLLGAAIHDQKALAGVPIDIPLATLNRHGLIAGATGTGKTKTIQKIVEELSEHGVNVLCMDIKGDLSGLARPGVENPKIRERMEKIGAPWSPQGYPVELLTISDEPGLRMRATVAEFGPLVFSRILELNENQEGVVTLVFKYCQDKNLPLIDLQDFRAVLQHLLKVDSRELSAYGAISPASVGVILRELLELEQQGGGKLFGSPSYDVNDFLKKDSSGRAVINILRLCDIQDKPKLFSSFMLCLLTEVYAKFPEIGDKGKPKLVIFIDEAHLLFRAATKNLLAQIETVIKLIRSKGVGIYFCTQLPSDVPQVVLSQLGGKFQHALRAFTAKDRKDIKLVSENYPITSFYKTNELLTELGIGEALLTVLNEKGNPTPLVQCLLAAPRSRMDLLTPEELADIVQSSVLASIYNRETP
ncbi:MAG: helicase HerA-like domain-containing protein, partial [Parachlamydiaceae bacterium]